MRLLPLAAAAGRRTGPPASPLSASGVGLRSTAGAADGARPDCSKGEGWRSGPAKRGGRGDPGGLKSGGLTGPTRQGSSELGGRAEAPSPYYTDKHVRWQRKVRAFMDAKVAPFVDEWDEAGEYPRALHSELYEAGIGGAVAYGDKDKNFGYALSLIHI